MIADLKDKVVLITGASTGIGAAAAKGFAAHGAKVVVNYNNSVEQGKAVAKAIADAGGEALLHRADVTDASALTGLVEATMAKFGRIDVLVNNAGAMLGRVPAVAMDDTHFERVMRLNCWSVFALSRAVAPLMARGGGGSIINVTSIAARNGGGGGANIYGAAKGFVSSFTKGLARELVADKIRVNAVSPGVIATPFHERYSSAAQMEAMRAQVPMGRVGASEDCVGAFLFLAAPSLSGYMTGQIVEVSGGQVMP